MGIAVFLCIAVASVTTWLFTMGSRGGSIADILAFATSALSAIAAAVQIYTSRPTPPEPGHTAKRRWKRWWKWVAAVMALAVLLVGGYQWFVVKPDIPVTDRATITGGERMMAGAEAVIHIPGEPPERRRFAFVPTLVNPNPVGDCVGSAQLKITLMIDGRKDFQDTGLLPGREIRVDLEGTTREAAVSVHVDMQDPSCEVNLSLAEAALFN